MDRWFEGTIGPKRVRMFMERGGEEVVGLYYDVVDWRPILIGGQWTNAGAIHLVATLTGSDTARVGTVNGLVSPSGELKGTWTANPSSGFGEQLVALRRIPEPSCDGSGTWRKFDSPKWPITFSYPASWHIQVSGADRAGSTYDEGISLMCPDPMSLAYGMAVDFSPEKMVNDNNVSDFIRFDGGPWMYGCGADNREFCRKPTVTRRQGITIYHADEIEFRLDCVDGGYVGQSAGNRFLLSFDRTWIQFYGIGSPSEIMDRILATVKLRN